MKQRKNVTTMARLVLFLMVFSFVILSGCSNDDDEDYKTERRDKTERAENDSSPTPSEKSSKSTRKILLKDIVSMDGFAGEWAGTAESTNGGIDLNLRIIVNKDGSGEFQLLHYGNWKSFPLEIKQAIVDINEIENFSERMLLRGTTDEVIDWYCNETKDKDGEKIETYRWYYVWYGNDSMEAGECGYIGVKVPTERFDEFEKLKDSNLAYQLSYFGKLYKCKGEVLQNKQHFEEEWQRYLNSEANASGVTAPKISDYCPEYYIDIEGINSSDVLYSFTVTEPSGKISEISNCNGTCTYEDGNVVWHFEIELSDGTKGEYSAILNHN